MMKKRQAEFPHLPAMKENVVEKDSTITCGKIKIRFFIKLFHNFSKFKRLNNLPGFGSGYRIRLFLIKKSLGNLR